MIRLEIVLLGLIGLSRGAGAQAVPDSVLYQAIVARTGGGGGCFLVIDTVSRAISYFPGVHFLAATCTLEHGSPYSAIVGTDSSGALYLLGDAVNLNYLLRRHPPIAVPAEDQMEYGQLLLELSGHIIHQAVRIDSAGQLPPTARRVLRSHLNRFQSQAAGSVTSFVTATQWYSEEELEWWQLRQIDAMHFTVDSDSVYEGRALTMYAFPRDSTDSTLMGQAQAASIDYADLHAMSGQGLPAGLAGLFDATPLFAGQAGKTHLDVLFVEWTHWGDRSFVKILRSRTAEVQRVVVNQMVNAVPDPANFKGMPHFVALAKSLRIAVPR